MKKVAIALFRNDLRLHDNPMLNAAIRSECTHMLPLFIYDHQFYSASAQTWNFKFPRLKAHKKTFLIEALADLKSSLKNVGSDLLVLQGDTMSVLKMLVKQENLEIFISKEFTYEEQVLERKLSSCFTVHLVDSAATILNPEDWVNGLPDVYTEFRIMVEKKKRNGEIEVSNWSKLQDGIPKPMPKYEIDEKYLFNFENSYIKDTRSAFPFKGGESCGLERLKSYIQTGGLKTYKQTRNRLLGTEYSTKFSPWLAIGCLSPKRILAELEACDSSFDEGVYWVWFELLWRDYFKLVSLKYKSKIFMESGLISSNKYSEINWYPDPGEVRFRAWSQGETGVPFVDANMRELLATGFMSNRGRQNVASYLVKDLEIDWRKGAEWFESLLIDHDPSVNYGNWLYVAGFGNDPRSSRYFNMIKQAKDYDAECQYVLSWCPELRKAVKNPSFYHTPWKDSTSTYTRPIVFGKGWDKHSYRKEGGKHYGNKGEKVKK
jgi:deoxyribodipyrimidine photo-lyase